MKKLSKLLSLVLFLSGCGPVPEIISETYEISNDSLYIKCADLQGFGNFIIDKSTMRDVMKDDGVDWFYREYGGNDFHSGFWGITEDYDLTDYIEKNNIIKQLQIGTLSRPYKIGELKFDEMDLAFLNDTLVAISIGGDFYKIADHYIEKYGSGQGYHHWYCKSRGQNGDRNFFMEKREHNLRVWANEKVKLEYKYDWESKVANNEIVYSIQGDDYCILTSQKRYDKFLSILENTKNEYKEQKEIKMKSSLERL